MPWCPKCKTEYREGFKVCNDCGNELTEKLGEENKEEETEKVLCKACSDRYNELVEGPEAKEEEETEKTLHKSCKKNESGKYLEPLSLFAGIIIIFFAPVLSYWLTRSYFIPDTPGIHTYDPEHFKWMLNAQLYAILLIGVIVCVPGIAYYFKNRRS